jgi:hypothetical protein
VLCAMCGVSCVVYVVVFCGMLWYVVVCCGMFCCAIGINNDEMGMFLWCSLPNQYGMCVCVMQFSSSWLAAVSDTVRDGSVECKCSLNRNSRKKGSSSAVQ